MDMVVVYDLRADPNGITVVWLAVVMSLFLGVPFMLLLFKAGSRVKGVAGLSVTMFLVVVAVRARETFQRDQMALATGTVAVVAGNVTNERDVGAGRSAKWAILVRGRQFVLPKSLPASCAWLTGKMVEVTTRSDGAGSWPTGGEKILRLRVQAPAC